MKWFLVIITAIFLFSCQKKHNLGEDYEKLIGTWGNINGDDSCTLRLSSNGIFEYYRSFTKNKNFKIISFEKVDESYLSYAIYKFSGRKDESYLYVSSTFDTLFVITLDITHNLHLTWENQEYLVKKQ